MTLTVVSVILYAVFSYSYEAGERETATDLLHAMYTFSLPTVYENDERVKELTTEDVYQRLTLSSSNRQLRVYLKFQGHDVEAKVIGHHDGIIYYYLDTQAIDSTRTFALRYKYKWGKIVDVAEYELFPLPQSERYHLE